jgi:hypothetical protein
MLWSSCAMADDLPALIAYSCDPQRSEFSINAEAEIATDQISARESDLRADHSKRTIQWRSLIKFGPKTNGRGDLLRTGTKTLTKSCGKLTIRFQGGYLNDNIQGQDGAVEFPVIDIRLGKRSLLGSTALNACDVNDSRTNYFGACPAKWAVSVRTTQTSKNSLSVTVKREFSDIGNVDRQTVESRKFHF